MDGNPKDYAAGWIGAVTTEYVAAQAFPDENHEGSAACSTSPEMDPLYIDSSEPWNIARSSPNSPSFEHRATDTTDVADFVVEDCHPPTQKRKRVNSPANELGLKRSRFHFVDAEFVAVAKVREHNVCIRCRMLKNRASNKVYSPNFDIFWPSSNEMIVKYDGDLPCDSCIYRESSICLWAQPCGRTAFSDLDIFGIGEPFL